MIDKKTAWDAMLRAGQVFLLSVIAWYAATRNETVNVEVKTPVAPVVTPVVTPARPVATPAAPAKPVATPSVPEVAPEETLLPPKVTTVIVEDQDRNRIRPALANTIANLADFQTGTYYYIGYPDEGTPVRRTITVSDGTGPRPPPVVVTPDQPPVVPVVPPVDPTTKPTAATYVFEKDQGWPSSAVMSGLNRLNREKKILATVLEQDSKNGDGQVADQDKVPLEEAKKAGLPALIVTANGVFLKAVKAPKTEQEVFDSVP